MKISIITPTFNRGNLIERAIQSILAQKHSDWEMIIIDDASTDSTASNVQKYLVDKRIKYIRCVQNSGVNKARNFGLKSMSDDSEVVTFLDSDDEFLPNALTDMVSEMFNHPKINYFRFGVKYTDGKLVSNPVHNFVEANFAYYIQNFFTIGEWVCTFRKKIIKEGFEYSNEVNAFESIAYIDLSQKETAFFSDKIVRIYHTGHDSISNEKFSKDSKLNAINGYELIISKFGENIRKVSKVNFSKLNYLLGYLLISNEEKRRGFTYTLSAFKNNPCDLRFFRNVLNIIFK